jgi:ABC-2 type transport system ATP-binding protein
MSIIEVTNLSKRYGDTQAVADFSFTANEGEILSLVGPDGAGKTSIFRAVCGLIAFDSGTVTIAGADIFKEYDRIKPILGYMPQTFSLYPDLSVEENLYFYAGMYGIARKKFHKKKQPLYEFSGLGPFAKRRATALSGGMKQKLALSCALIHDPKVFVLDEPTTGVDPLSRRQFWELLKELKSSGSAIVVSTPYMDEVELSDRAIFIHNGGKLSEGSPRELVCQFDGSVYRIDIAPTTERMEYLNRMEGLAARRFGSSLHLYVSRGAAVERYIERLRKIGIEEGDLREVDPGLEDVFIQRMGG